MANTGWDEALDGLTVPRLAALQAEWRDNPPAHWLLAALARYKRPSGGERTAEREQTTVAAIQAAFPGGRI